MARARVQPNAENASLAELRAAAKCARTQREHDRFQAIIALIMGFGAAQVAKLFNVNASTLRRWVVQFNRRGIDGLIEGKRPGRPRKIDGEKAKRCCEILEHPEQAGRVHWTGVKLHGYICEELQLEVGYSTLIRFLHERQYRLRVPQPWPDRQDEKERQVFCDRLKELLAEQGVELWYGDETGIEGDPRPRRRWAKPGEKVRSTKNGDHLRMSVMGMVCPRTGEVYALEFTHVDTDVFQAFLREANNDLRLERPRQVLIVDNASWHKAKRLDWGRFEPFYLPRYSPDLNPIERLWLLLKAEWFTNYVAKDQGQLISRIDQALLWLIGREQANTKTCAVPTTP
jgi:transposase